MIFRLTPRSMNLDDLELLQGQILSEFRMILRFWKAIKTAKRMKIDPYCQRRNCSPLNALFSDLQVTLISQGVHPIWGIKQVRGGETSYFQLNASISLAMALTAAAFYDSVIFGVSIRKNKCNYIPVVINVILFSMKLTK